MKVLPKNSNTNSHRTTTPETFLDIETIRRRVAKIKNRWTPEMTEARAIEGARRRVELESLVLDLTTGTSESEENCDLGMHGFSLVG